MSSGSKSITGQENLDGWLRCAAGLSGALRWHQVAGGLSNLTYVVTDEQDRRVVLRRPPGGEHVGGAHDVLREARIMAALRPTPVPVPEVLAMCDDPQPAGVPCYVMEHVAGEPVESPASVGRLSGPDRHRLGVRLIDILADLQAVDLDAAGLSELRRRTPYLERQTRRWNAQWRATAQRTVPAIDHVSRRLPQILPQLEPQPDRLVHGDFRLGNVMVATEPEPRVSALLDWELATVGHPLADLGFLGARVQAPAGVLEPDGDPLAAPGFPAFGELVSQFGRRTGVSVAALPVFVALAAWRWAIIVEGIQQRFSQGQMGDLHADAAWHRRRVELLAGFAADVLG
jgi:aminoglycoside phosphotransferase (APT) family kinase protein